MKVIDYPDERKVHKKIMPRMGGLSIFLASIAGITFLNLYSNDLGIIFLCGLLILLLGIIDDVFRLSARVKLSIELFVAVLIVLDGIRIETLSLPFSDEKLFLGNFSYLITVLWIVGIINSVNLIDGLDGLAAGISFINLLSIAIMAYMAGEVVILTLSAIVMMSTLGFLFYNFYPAKIFMGDTGSLFLGYVIAILSLLGMYKSVTLFNMIIPIIILGVPITDTFFAIIRRILNRRPISEPDKSHLHHKLMNLGLSHRNTVLTLYGVSIVFSLLAFILVSSTLWVSSIIIILFIILVQAIAETVGLVNDKYKPFLSLFKKIWERRKNLV